MKETRLSFTKENGLSFLQKIEFKKELYNSQKKNEMAYEEHRTVQQIQTDQDMYELYLYATCDTMPPLPRQLAYTGWSWALKCAKELLEKDDIRELEERVVFWNAYEDERKPEFQARALEVLAEYKAEYKSLLIHAVDNVIGMMADGDDKTKVTNIRDIITGLVILTDADLDGYSRVLTSMRDLY